MFQHLKLLSSQIEGFLSVNEQGSPHIFTYPGAAPFGPFSKIKGYVKRRSAHKNQGPNKTKDKK